MENIWINMVWRLLEVQHMYQKAGTSGMVLSETQGKCNSEFKSDQIIHLEDAFQAKLVKYRGGDIAGPISPNFF